MARVFRTLAEQQNAQTATFEVPAAVEEATVSVGSAGSIVHRDGDVTDAIAPPQATPREKADLVEKLNADAKKQQQQEIKKIVHEQAAAILRHRVVALASAESVKTFMETSNRGLVARTVIIDVTKPRSRQSGVKSPTPSAKYSSAARTNQAGNSGPDNT